MGLHNEFPWHRLSFERTSDFVIIRTMRAFLSQDVEKYFVPGKPVEEGKGKREMIPVYRLASPAVHFTLCLCDVGGVHYEEAKKLNFCYKKGGY